MRSCLSILSLKQVAGVLALSVLFLGGHFAASFVTRKPIAFQSAREFKEFAVAKGFYLHSGNKSGVITDSYFIADHPVTCDDLLLTWSRKDCGLTLAWGGILWVCQLYGTPAAICPELIGGKWRVWGKIVVAGDEALMDRLEELYRKD